MLGLSVGVILIYALFVWIIPIFVANAIGQKKQRAGWAYGFFLGWLGVITVALLPSLEDPNDGICPFCKETVKLAATVCRHCGREMTPEARPAKVQAGRMAQLDPHAMTRPCPACEAGMQPDLELCPSCGERSKPWRFHDGYWWWWQERAKEWLWYDPAANEWKHPTEEMAVGSAASPVEGG